MTFGTADIFATARILAGRGFGPLRIGATYDRDAQARFGLDDALTARLRAAHVIHDGDEGGQLFQLCSEPRADGFFLEIVQRQGDHAGHGAPDAPFRIAARKRAARPAC